MFFAKKRKRFKEVQHFLMRIYNINPLGANSLRAYILFLKVNYLLKYSNVNVMTYFTSQLNIEYESIITLSTLTKKRVLMYFLKLNNERKLFYLELVSILQ